MKACIKELHIGEALLEGKIQQLIEAMELASVIYSYLMGNTSSSDIYI